MITVQIMGGLGNQLFQIITLISYAIDNKVEFYFENEIKEGTRKTTYWNNFLTSLQRYIKSIQNNNIPVLRWYQHHYVKLPQLHNKNINCKLIGYFQSPKYFYHNIDKIKSILEIENSKEKIKNKTNYDYDNTVSLHFRLGDYKHLQEHHRLLTIDYYLKSLEKLINDTNKNNWNILYFFEENDKILVEEKINILKSKFNKLNFIGINNKLEDWEQILSMSLCKHNIIANSTFSWWGAFFNTNKSNVYYPSKWFGPKLENNKMDDLFLNDWVKIDI